jgi:hypothetical protein
LAKIIDYLIFLHFLGQKDLGQLSKFASLVLVQVATIQEQNLTFKFNAKVKIGLKKLCNFLDLENNPNP